MNVLKKWVLGFFFLAIICMFPSEVVKAEVNYGYEYKEEENAYYLRSVSFSETDHDMEITLPEFYNGCPVVGMKSHAFKYDDEVKKVIVPSTYTYIGQQAFYYCRNLKEVVIKGQITTLKNATFQECKKLEKVTLPDSLKEIEPRAFFDCGIKFVNIPKYVNKVGAYAFLKCKNLCQIIVEGEDTVIDSRAFFEVEADFTIVALSGSKPYETAVQNYWPVYAAEDFYIEPIGKKMYVGEKQKLILYYNMNKVKWSSSNKSIITVSSDGTMQAKKTGSATITAKVDGKSYKYKITVVKRTEKNVLDIIWKYHVTKDMSDFEKIVATNKWLIQNLKFDDNATSSNKTVKKALEKGIATHEGYAKTFEKILSHYKLSVEVLEGRAFRGSNRGYERHVWNLVKLGKNWFHVDVAWNDWVYGNKAWYFVGKDFLLSTDSEILKYHTWHKKGVPVANSKEKDYKLTTLNSSKIQLNTNRQFLLVGKSATIKVSGTKKIITWTSSNTKVATVSSKGKVTAKKAGTVTIKAKIDKNTYNVKVYVRDAYLNKTSVTLGKGAKNFKLTLSGATAKKFTSSNSSIVTVSSKGVLTAKKAGTATISVQASNGKTYKCKVTVETYSLSSKKTLKLGETYQLSLKGAKAKSQILWETSNSEVAMVDSKGLVTALKGGTATISATLNGATHKCKITVHVHKLTWKADKEESGASATCYCKECNEVIRKGVMLIDINGTKQYGVWTTGKATEDVFSYLNKKLTKNGYDKMVLEPSLEPDLVDFMLEMMETRKDDIADMGYSFDNGKTFFSLNEGESIPDHKLEDMYSDDIELGAQQKGEDEKQHFYMISFTWDVYGDGTTMRDLYIYDAIRTNYLN